MNETQTVFEALLSEMKKGASRTDACRNLGIAIHKTYHVLSKKRKYSIEEPN